MLLKSLFLIGIALVPKYSGAQAMSPSIEDSKADATPPSGSVNRIYQEDAEKTSRFTLGGFYYVLKSDGVTVSGFGVSGGVTYGLLSKLSAAGGLRQAYSRESGLTTLFTAIDASLVYVVSGADGANVRSLSLDDKQVARFTTSHLGGWRVAAGITQYFLNTSFSAVPYSGFTFATYYEVPGNSFFSFDGGFQAERISNGKRAIYPMSLFLRTLVGK